jgi:hypothetical protein
MTRPVRHQGRTLSLAPEARAEDLRRGTLTFRDEATGAPVVVAARDLMGGPPDPAREAIALRTLFEEALRLEFSDQELEEILLFAARHRVLETPDPR